MPAPSPLASLLVEGGIGGIADEAIGDRERAVTVDAAAGVAAVAAANQGVFDVAAAAAEDVDVAAGGGGGIAGEEIGSR